MIETSRAPHILDVDVIPIYLLGKGYLHHASPKVT